MVLDTIYSLRAFSWAMFLNFIKQNGNTPLITEISVHKMTWNSGFLACLLTECIALLLTIQKFKTHLSRPLGELERFWAYFRIIWTMNASVWCV